MQNVANMCHPVLVIPINYKKTQTGYINSLVTKKKCLTTGYIYKSSSLCHILSAKVIVIKSIYEPLICHVADKISLCRCFHFFKYELMPLSANINIENESKIQFSPNDCLLRIRL